MRPERFGSDCPAGEKAELVQRLLAGETLAELARETGRPKKQLSAWRRRFLAGGEAYLDGRREGPDLEALRDAKAELTTRMSTLEAENERLTRQVALLSKGSSGTTHPYCSEAYARAFEEPGVELFYVAAWGAHVFVREGQAGVRQATGTRPYGSLDPAGDPRAGLEELREAGVTSVSTITDPMWCPEGSSLRAAFDVYQPFGAHHLIDREAGVQIRKRHRNRINQARRASEVRDVALADHLDSWLEFYWENVEERQIKQPYTNHYFGQFATLEGLRTIAVFVDDEVVTLSLWVAHEDMMYFHESASSPVGKAISGAHAAYAHAIDTTTDRRFVVFGPRSGLRDDRSDGLATFKRGFANTERVSYLCSASLTN